MIADIPQTASEIRRAAARLHGRLKSPRLYGRLEELLSENPSMIIVDLFCGAGGTSTGFAKSMVAKVIACVNHDPKAINSHWANHPDVDHFTEDMRYLDLADLIAICKKWQAIYPNAKLVLWASLECTNFSKAKGGLARDADSRTLADHLHRYITALDPDYVMIENVVEFRDWGPVQIKAKKTVPFPFPHTELTIIKQKRVENVLKTLKSGKKVSRKKLFKIPTYGWTPIKALKGTDFKRWCDEVKAHGYEDGWKEMNSADYGAYTSRNRLFGMFVKPSLNIVWPDKTHSKKGTGDKKWKAVKHVLDFSNQGYSIFSRSTNPDIPIKQRKDLVEKTLERVYAGLIKFVAGGKDKFIAKTYAVASNHHGCYSVDAPGHTLTTRGCHQLVSAQYIPFISRYNSGDDSSRNTTVDEPCRVITTENRHALVQCQTVPFIAKYYSGRPEGKVIDVDGPAGTITTVDGQSLVQPEFIVQRNSGNPESKIVSVDGPARTLTSTGGNQDLIQPSFITKYHGEGGGQLRSLCEPCATLACKDQFSIVSAEYILNYQHSSDANSVDNPFPTVVTKDKYAVVQAENAFLDKQYSGPANNQSINTPAGTIMPNDKHNLVTTVPFIDRQFSSGGHNSSIEDPAGSITSVPKLNLVQPCCFIDNTHYNNAASSIDEPLRVITADRHYAYLVNPSWSGNPSSIENPSPVIIARQDKSPMYLVVTEEGKLAIEIYETDSPCTKKIKEFMALYGIIDIKMRMLEVPELLQIQGFPKGYRLDGSKADQKKFIGNSVVPDVVQHWALAIDLDLQKNYFKVA